MFLKTFLLFFFATVSAFSAEGPTLKQRQLCELKVTRGMLSWNLGRYQLAEQDFQSALEEWQNCYLAHEAMAFVKEKKENLRGAIESLLEAKHHEPDMRWGFVNFHIGRLYLDLRAEDKAEVYLKVALEQNAYEVQAHYLLGYIAYRNEKYLDAENHFHEALILAKKENAAEEEKNLIQSLEFYLGEIDMRLGFSRDAITSFWNAEVGMSSEIRKAAWQLHSSYNHIQKSFGFGVFHRADTNVAKLAYGQAVPSELNGQGSQALSLVWDGKITTAQGRPFVVGAQALGTLNYHFINDMGRFDELNLNASVFGKYWNRKTWSIQPAYNINRYGLGRYSYEAYQWLHGPSVEFEYFPNHRWTYYSKYSLNLKTFPKEIGVVTENNREGTSHAVGLGMKMVSPNPSVRPFGEYVFKYEPVTGVNFSYMGHQMTLGFENTIYSRLEGMFSIQHEWRSYYNSLSKRVDKELGLRAGLKSAFLERFVVSIDANYSRNFSNVNDFRLARFEINTGIIFRFY